VILACSGSRCAYEKVNKYKKSFLSGKMLKAATTRSPHGWLRALIVTVKSFAAQPVRRSQRGPLMPIRGRELARRGFERHFVKNEGSDYV